ncbi:MAG TPA: hypothetical protein VJZ75_00265 [Candidatus Bathyarchaeia archaeon]|nr:hypothetical protein [Candidatus Bathyarchaeia archaeon]
MDKRVTRGGSIPVDSDAVLSMYGASRHSLPLMNVLSILFGFLAISVLAAFSFRASAPYVIGENLVVAEVNLGILIIKPITLFTYLFFLSFAFGLNSPISKQRLLGIGDQFFESLYIVAWFFVMLTGFEVIYNAVLWCAGLSVQGLQNPDIIVNWWPANPYAINVVFAAKLVVLVFAISCFSVDYLRRIRTTREKIRDVTLSN